MEEVGASLWLHYLDLSRICPPGVRSIRYQHIFCILIPELTTYCLLRNFQEFFKVQNPPNLCCIVNSWRLQYKAIVPAIAFELNLKQMVDQVFLSFFISYFLYIETPDFALAKEEDKQKDKDKVKHDRKEKDKYMGNTKKK